MHLTFLIMNHVAVHEIVDDNYKLMDSRLLPIIKNEASNEIKDQYLDSIKAREVIRSGNLNIQLNKD